MRRATVVLVALAALLLAAPVAPAVAPRSFPVAWRLVEAGPKARSIVVGYTETGCPEHVTAHVRATRSAIRVALTRGPFPPEPIVCPAIALQTRETIHLAGHIAGRPIRGGTASEPPLLACPPTGRCTLPAPRLLGLAPADARGVLRGIGLKTKVSRGDRRGGWTRVLAQRPKVHATVGRTRTAHLVRSRTG